MFYCLPSVLHGRGRGVFPSSSSPWVVVSHISNNLRDLWKWDFWWYCKDYEVILRLAIKYFQAEGLRKMLRFNVHLKICRKFFICINRFVCKTLHRIFPFVLDKKQCVFSRSVWHSHFLVSYKNVFLFLFSGLTKKLSTRDFLKDMLWSKYK